MRFDEIRLRRGRLGLGLLDLNFGQISYGHLRTLFGHKIGRHFVGLLFHVHVPQREHQFVVK